MEDMETMVRKKISKLIIKILSSGKNNNLKGFYFRIKNLRFLYRNRFNDLIFYYILYIYLFSVCVYILNLFNYINIFYYFNG